jgi:diaminohydroxyphosphoribosylaminopyrimidine deaminase/5-amino-6-(5-phosphoribosylamino)uracil reductase
MDDLDRIRQAFELARAARGATLPNPSVGAVVWDARGKLVGRAATSPSGRPHAERQALEAARKAAEGGTMAVTLEPCVAFPGKKSPPCAAALILSGIERVIVGCEDPNPQVRGKGIHALRRAGIQVDMLDPEGRIADFYAGFGVWQATKRPRVTLKVALSADGRANPAPGVRGAITGDAARAFVHRLRSVSDAVLVGASTLSIDDPRLTVRDVPGPTPRPLVLSGTSPVPAARTLWSDPRTVVLGPRRPEGLPRGIAFAAVPSDEAGADLGAVLDLCGAEGIHDLLVEPGPKLLAAFLRSGLWDRLWVLRSPEEKPGGSPFDPEGLLPAGEPVERLELGSDTAGRWERAMLSAS